MCVNFLQHALWFLAKSIVNYFWIFEIMIGDSVQIKSLSSKQWKLPFWYRLNPKKLFLWHLSTQRATWPTSHRLLTSFNIILKAKTNMVFWDHVWGWSELFIFFFKQSRLHHTLSICLKIEFTSNIFLETSVYAD